MTIDATAEIEQAGERAVLGAYTNDFLDRALAGALDRAQSIAHGARRQALFGKRIEHRLKAVIRFVYIGSQNGYAVSQGLHTDNLHLVGFVQVGGYVSPQ